MIILIDQDEVLADFDGEITKRWRERYPNRFFLPIEQKKTFYFADSYPKEYKDDIVGIYTEPGFIRSLPVIPGAIEAVKYLRKKHKVYICTSPLSSYENCILEKFQWIEEYFGKNFIKNTIITKDKTLVYGNILIDDKPEITGLLKPFWEHIIFDQPHNRNIKEKRRINWRNFKDILNV